MKTSKPFSTISYNTSAFLQARLDTLLQAGVIEFYSFIQHHREDDETKEHIHLYVEPSGLIDTQKGFIDKILEPDPENALNKPLCCIRCRPSKFADWYMYSIHDVDYLATKMETRKYHYRDEDFVNSSNDVMLELIHESDLSKYKAFKKFRDSIASGVSFRELFENGFIPVQQINQYEKAYYLLKGQKMVNRTFRGGRKNHEHYFQGSVELVDEETGELVNDIFNE